MRHHRSQKRSPTAAPQGEQENEKGGARRGGRGNAARQESLQAPGAAPAVEGEGAGGVSMLSEAEVEAEQAGEGEAEDVAEQESSGGGGGGPTGNPELDSRLSEAFGSDMGGVEAHFGEGSKNDALGAEAHAEGKRTSFGAGIRPDTMDPKQLNVIAHEMAHALSTVGGKDEGVDLPGDKGEKGADQAGKGFQRWAETGFEGKAPRLKPAQGGGASIQRKAKKRAVGLTGSPALARGARGGRVSTLQTLLRRHGYRVAVDGDFGPATYRAVRAFQAKKRLGVDGIVGPKTAAALNRSAGGGGGSKKPSRGGSTNLGPWLPLRQGARNTGVRRLQERLNRFKARIQADGVFGANTARAVRAFQRSNGLSADGVVGPRTAAKLASGSARNIKYGDGGGGGGNQGPLPGKYLGRYEAYRNGRYLGKIKVVQMDGKKVALKTAYAWKKLKAAAKRDGVYLRLNSGFRTMSEQKYFYNLWLSGRGNRAAPPGYSNHQHGQALDIDVAASSHYRWMHSRAPSFGWRRTVSDEPWHWEYFGR